MAFCRYRSITVQYLRECDINNLAHVVQTVIRPLLNTRSPRRLLTATIGFVLFSYFASLRLNPVVIRYCVINLAPFQEITNAFIISKNGFVHARYCTSALFCWLRTSSLALNPPFSALNWNSLKNQILFHAASTAGLLCSKTRPVSSTIQLRLHRFVEVLTLLTCTTTLHA